MKPRSSVAKEFFAAAKIDNPSMSTSRTSLREIIRILNYYYYGFDGTIKRPPSHNQIQHDLERALGALPAAKKTRYASALKLLRSYFPQNQYTSVPTPTQATAQRNQYRPALHRTAPASQYRPAPAPGERATPTANHYVQWQPIPTSQYTSPRSPSAPLQAAINPQYDAFPDDSL